MISKIKENSNNTFCLVTDSGCDLPISYLNAEGIKCVQLRFYFESDEVLMTGNDISSNEFYERIKNGETAKTSAPSPADFENEFRMILESGKDILYLGFDSELSTTVNSARIAATELLEEYKERKILILDTLCASAGQGLLVAMTKNKINSGLSINEAYEYAKNLAPMVSHRFTVETLTYLCRGGRIGKTAAMAGNLLNVKPVLHLDDAGHLINLYKARGRVKSLSMLLDAYEETAMSLKYKSCVAAGAENIDFAVDEYDSCDDMIMISHSNCREDADKLAEMIKTRFDRNVDIICDIGPVIGSHAGPGTIALFFIAACR